MEVPDEVVRTAYSDRAAEYTALLGSVDVSAEADRRLIAEWATSLDGLVIDAGCGPGHWAGFMAELGVDVEGVDLVPAFVEIARSRHPSVPFRVGALDDLQLPDAAAAGVLAWYSLIHLEPERMDVVLTELARCTRDRGGLVIGFFHGDRVGPFSHAVTTAYQWPAEELAHRLERAAFVTTRTDIRRHPEGADRIHGTIVAQRRPRNRSAR